MQFMGGIFESRTQRGDYGVKKKNWRIFQSFASAKVEENYDGII